MTETAASLVMEAEGEKCAGPQVAKLHSWTAGGAPH